MIDATYIAKTMLHSLGVLIVADMVKLKQLTLLNFNVTKMRTTSMKTVIPNPTGKWEDSDWSDFRDYLKSILINQTAEVSFTKVNGDLRVMDCTLNPKVLPQVTVTEGSEKTARKKSDTSLTVFDIKANGWRSFVVRNIQAVNYRCMPND